MPLGLYISVPFCRTKCSFCNFASGVFSRELFDRYLDRVISDIEAVEVADRGVDSIYLGGGTPSVLAPDQLERLFSAVRDRFEVHPVAEVTVECAPGTLSRDVIDVLVRCSVNRVSLGVQSFVDQEARSVGRLHTREITFADIANLRQAGISNLSVDLIAGLPHQTVESWRYSLDEVISSGVPHVSVYMLEVDEDSRLGRELMAGGTRYHAHFVPDDDSTADFYQLACDTLNAAGVEQYEISNFARSGFESRHNLKYWLRQPYLGFGVDAHSMLLTDSPEAMRLATADNLDEFLVSTPMSRRSIDRPAAEDEAFFLGLRLNRGINLQEAGAAFGSDALLRRETAIQDLMAAELLRRAGHTLCLTDRGRLLSNEVFERLTLADSPVNDQPARTPAGRYVKLELS